MKSGYVTLFPAAGSRMLLLLACGAMRAARATGANNKQHAITAEAKSCLHPLIVSLPIPCACACARVRACVRAWASGPLAPS